VTAQGGQRLKSQSNSIWRVSSEPLREHLARIDKNLPTLNAVVQLCGGRAMEEARAAEPNRSYGEVHGYPSWRCRSPSKTRQSLIPPPVSVPVWNKGAQGVCAKHDCNGSGARLRGAGRFYAGKTNTHERRWAYENGQPCLRADQTILRPASTCGGKKRGAALFRPVGGRRLDVGSATGEAFRVPSHFLRALPPGVNRMLV